jgi:hypothetical protein
MDPGLPRRRAPFGLFEAAILLAVACMALWAARPLPGARRSAAEETVAYSLLTAVADAEDALAAPGKKASPYLRLDRLGATVPAVAKALQGWVPAKTPGVYGSRSYWIAVLLPARDGALEAPGAESAEGALRGYCVVAWPRTEAPAVLRALAAFPDGVMWQRVDGAEESGDATLPPVPRVTMSLPGQGPRVPPPPPDWAVAARRKKAK